MRFIAFQAFFGSITKSLKLEVEANVLESGLSYCLEGTDKIQKIINPNKYLAVEKSGSHLQQGDHFDRNDRSAA